MVENTNSLINLSQVRTERARQILEKNNPECMNDNCYLVPSQYNPNVKYLVQHNDTFTCNCPDFKKRCQSNGIYCKHIRVVTLFLEAKNQVKDSKLEFKIQTENKQCCPFCKSQELIKRGIRKTIH